ncbi:MAG: hypothetical protein HQL73_11660 [Magnetococcales bacterium]|nr:hypothetical protein [Magnetococcales bacterium]
MNQIDLLGRYHALPLAAKVIMEIKVLLGEGQIVKTAFLEVVKAIGGQATEEKGWTASHVDSVLMDLRKRGLLDNKWDCPPELLHPITAEVASRPGWSGLLQLILLKFPVERSRSGYILYISQSGNLKRALRLSIYSDSATLFQEYMTLYNSVFKSSRVHQDDLGQHYLYFLFQSTPLDIGWLSRRPDTIRRVLFQIKLDAFHVKGVVTEDFPALLTYFKNRDEGATDENGDNWTYFYCLFSGELELLRRATATLPDEQQSLRYTFQGVMDFLTGENESALDHFRTGLKVLRRQTGRRKFFFNNATCLYFFLSLLA